MERVRKRYSLALKQKIMEEIRDGKWTSAWQASKMYGIKDQTVYKWMDKLGFSHLKTRIVEVKTLDEIDEVKQLRKQVKELKLALAEETLSRQIEQATVQVASSIIGISVEELKKKLARCRAADGRERRGRGCEGASSEAPPRLGGLQAIREIACRLLRRHEAEIEAGRGRGDRCQDCERGAGRPAVSWRAQDALPGQDTAPRGRGQDRQGPLLRRAEAERDARRETESVRSEDDEMRHQPSDLDEPDKGVGCGRSESGARF